ncbi:hypothetical protein G5C01_00640 [Moraxella bovoculi]|nr:hypothetical protein [Moraxella bovoculi]NSM09901.1 hypothetical protein [Moraxella bovoculi]
MEIKKESGRLDILNESESPNGLENLEDLKDLEISEEVTEPLQDSLTIE